MIYTAVMFLPYVHGGGPTNTYRQSCGLVLLKKCVKQSKIMYSGINITKIVSEYHCAATILNTYS